MKETIIELLDHEPFHPFRVVLTSGEGYDILNPHLLARGQAQMNVYQPGSDRFAILRLNQVASVEVTPQAA